MTIRKLDWKPNHDPKSRLYGIGDAPSTLIYRYHRLRNPVLDQAEEGACVGHGTINACSAIHMKLWLPDPQATAFGMYFGTRYIDEWEGEDYSGTSVNAGCKLAVSMGFAKDYSWAFGVEEVAQAILKHGPVILGFVFLVNMFEPDSNGFLDVSGAIAGGHCLCAYGFQRNLGTEGGVFSLRQSWGVDHGKKGNVFIHYNQLDYLLKQEGEAAVLNPIPQSATFL